MSVDFSLHPTLAADCLPVGQLPLCQLLLMNDARYPWLILVPRLPGLRELFEVPVPERTQLFNEIDQVSQTLLHLFEPDKLNVAALGNQVPQLHLHLIARFHQDAAWPQPIWGRGAPQPYNEAQAQARLQALQQRLELNPAG